MSRIAVLHPQCVRVGGAIQMALQTTRALQQQGHTVTLYTFEKSDECFPDLQAGINIETWHKKTGGKLFNIITLAFHLRQFDIIIANNPPMQIVAALAKLFSRKKVQTIWWHHHVPWYLIKGQKTKDKRQSKGSFYKNNPLFCTLYFVLCTTRGWKNILERHLIIAKIDQMIATSHFVAEKIQEYCGREAVVVHPVIQEIQSTKYRVQNDGSLIGSNEGNKLNQLNALNSVTLFTHGRLEAGKGIDMLVNTFQKIQSTEYKVQNDGTESTPPCERSMNERGGRGGEINLIIFGTGSMEKSLREQGIDVRPFEGQKTFSALSTGEYGHVIGVYCSSIDAFGMASLESQMAGFPTIIMDRGGAREAILSDDDNHPVGYLVHTEEELSGTISRYVQKKILEKQLSNVNFSHKRDYFSTERLSSDLLSIITKTGQ